MPNAVPAPSTLAPRPAEASSPYNAVDPRLVEPKTEELKPISRIPAQGGEPPLANLVESIEQPIAIPASRAVPVVDLKPVSRPIATIEFQAPEDGSLSPELSKRVSYAEDYSWVKGQLRKIGEQWLIIYTGDERDDLFGGRFLLAPQVNMGQCRNGDLVSVRGQVVAGRENADSPATYRAVAIEVLQR